MADARTRPARVALIAGTGTEVGKTWIAVRVIERLRADAGLRVAARKPAQSFLTGEGPTDAELLAAATGERPHDVCAPQRWYPLPMAPLMAADALGRAPFTLADLVAELSWPAPAADVGVVESAGGVRSPISADGGDTVDLADALTPDLVVLVADAGLGTINAVRLCLDALAQRPTVVVLNRYDHTDDLHRRNRTWLTDTLAQPVLIDSADVAAAIQSGSGARQALTGRRHSRAIRPG
ncbi:MAG: dethiobiotin synthetase [Acidimicrobiaceae bacterium]|nr:dethiobiotin synthetase [Acidimicrobiaceae bacterium]